MTPVNIANLSTSSNVMVDRNDLNATSEFFEVSIPPADIKIGKTVEMQDAKNWG